ncbi:MAG: ribonucleoside-diphosphate reductase, adenosylcobalamin-dependent [Candidatus Doudnabacteria bacterium RIFCSPHIGHO2_02_FULL_48_21]|uniref:Vitamin B12-dependent ribonucleotide reductase n=1 Tax=Candidatus Doudnabacteria bacterium RIFCSPLOWO2_02_FULL_48_13 TaxID=1817845 RepID=A0A1F5Q8Q4_9BACT|nr:MAG: ribonucleoside-diphosphate reductase, adenosylcobalamin-dependent [Candidatus Doudnabacteria bacterium RIFCSPHIGHO2_01_48_18]OGE91398.1 MAG: ribonucleoside-diphosphate reductase, adenosylcobalamin-dependent [Candidatus Doudnabacteria bacterium RIFCSPHIGHO2_12_FULL_47_25]OGE93214.1 MAG: ribonucleoside-diphosphate reductase, adenosylcobalamin-dependent [Candidatus Doudnabacteria bacterium RIFCSPHIGHO2_02_FULL_48_21]OGE96728.1 MAG: ribonucleoside-diphosphate reductase, adenosylcobalamin-dep
MMKKRYLVKREDGTQETPAEMIHRIAHAVATADRAYGLAADNVRHWEKEFFEIVARKEFTPAGRTITNAGAPSPVVANCIVLPIEDSMEGIFKTLKDAALLQKAGSGLGFSFGRLRPAGTYVKQSQGMASGPVSFLQVYNQAFGVIKQQGRHGANMAILPVDHPDILDFVHCKRVEGDIRNFNISVGMTDEFMKAVTEKPNEPWLCNFQGEKMKPRRITRDRFGVVVSIEDLDMTARELYAEIVRNAWHNGEPGVIFLDAFNRGNTMPKTPIEATNPCGEQGLPPYDVCNLGSINLAAFVKDGKLDVERLKHVSMVSSRFLDNVIDLFDYPVREVQEMSRNTRRLGLGVMGYADMLYQMNIRYDSDKGFETGELVMRTIQESSHNTSVALAAEKGEFPYWKDSTWAEKAIRRRNTMVTTVAPTGSISMFFDTSSGIEPNFALAFTKQDKDGHTYKYLNRYLEAALVKHGISEEIKEKIVQEGSVANIAGIPQDVKDTFRVAMDISAVDHIRAQGAFQKYVENSISKTINFPNEATIQDIEDGYILAWRLGCKGCTLYRDGSREVQVLNLNKNLDKAKSLAPGMEHMTMAAKESGVAEKVEQILSAKIVNGSNNYKTIPRERPEVMRGLTYRTRTSYGNLFVTINEDDHGPFEVFSSLGKAGGFFHAQTEAICRLISLALRSGIAITEIIDQLKGIRGPDIIFANGGTIHSLPDAIGQVLENHIKRGQTELGLKFTEERNPQVGASEMVGSAEVKESISKVGNGHTEVTSIANLGHAPACPDCGNMLMMAEGCLKCDLCGFSKCG